jgi:hypothetical protein
VSVSVCVCVSKCEQRADLHSQLEPVSRKAFLLSMADVLRLALTLALLAPAAAFSWQTCGSPVSQNPSFFTR